jgi:ATP-dependent exoDNAse (exonuclease V) beta subunit
MSAPRPTPQQAAAIATRDRDVFCEAGAGSGKTRVLVGRYCGALLEDGVGMDRVLAFTFTERAAAELRHRIRAELGRAAARARDDGDTERASELRALARQTDRAWVSTIHGFCRRLLAAHPAAAGLDPRFRVLAEAEAERLREQAALEAIEQLIAEGDDAVRRAAAAYRPERLAGMALQAHERLRNQGMADPKLPEVGEPRRSVKQDGEEPEPLTPRERAAAVEARAALEAVLERLHSRYEELKAVRSGLDFLDLELRALALLRSSEAIASRWRERFLHILVDEFQDTNRVQLKLIEALSGPRTRLFTVGDENQSIYRFRNADLEVFRAARERARGSPDTEIHPLRGNFRSRPEVLAAANAVGRALIPRFPELEAGADPAGEPRAELLLTWDESPRKSKWAEVEEELWRDEGSDEPPSVSGPRARPRVVAEARALAERLRELVDAGEARPGDIVVLLRAFTHVDAYEEALRRYGLDPYVVGGRGYWSQQQVEDLLRLLAVIANPLDDEMLFGALAGPACAVTPDTLWLLRRGAGSGRHVWPALERRFGAAHPGAERDAGPAGAEANGSRPQSAETERPGGADGDGPGSATGGDGRRGPDPGDPSAEWAGREPDPEALAAIQPDDAAKLRAFCEKVARLRAEAPLLPLDVLVERTMNAFRYDLALLARPQGAGRMANVRKLMRLAAEFEANEGRDLRGFLEQAERATQRDEREGLAPMQPEDHDGVRIMTVHGAKGLEFPVVAVPDLGRELSAGFRYGDIRIGRDAVGDRPRFGLRLVFPSEDSLGAWELHELDREELDADAEEACRLIYVAATRAQERLILSGVCLPRDLEPLEEPGSRDTALRRLLPALKALGWNGEEGVVGLPAPPLVGNARDAEEPTGVATAQSPDGAPAGAQGTQLELGSLESEPGKEQGAPVRAAVRVRISRPTPERARELTPKPLAPALRSAREDRGERARPPLISGRPSPVPLGHLSYSALDAYKRCGYRFYVERVLGLRQPVPGAAALFPREREELPAEGRADDELVASTDALAAGTDAGARARGLGNAVHEALEWSARRDWAEPGEQLLAALLEREGVGDADSLGRARELILGWLGSELCAQLRGSRLRPEAPFVLPLGATVLRGSIDLLAETDAGPQVIDFKTDRVGPAGVAELGERYAEQRAVYALAAAASHPDAESIQTAHVLLERPDEPVVERFDAAALARARKRLERLVERIRGGEFEVTDEPFAALCFGCPAAARLCPRPAWRPRREAAARAEAG